ncbi:MULTISPECIES: hypothetical protein [unclassified Streptomyces]|uniref:hypothetical protein n=1 Tax=unclassified Streptomyces TaxID=2593676 RepID=UPI003D929B41
MQAVTSTAQTLTDADQAAALEALALPALLRLLAWSAAHHEAEAARLEGEARAAHPARRAAVAAWWTVAQWFTACPHPVLLLMLADLPDSPARTVDAKQWWAPLVSQVTGGGGQRLVPGQAESSTDITVTISN